MCVHPLMSVILLSGALTLAAAPSFAQEQQAKPPGLWLPTDFPDLTEHIGDDPTLAFSLTGIR
jgi:hypothetical protein